MSEDKSRTDLAEPIPEWVEDQCQKFEATLLGFTDAMRQRFREKAHEGRGRWLRAESAPALYQAMLAHAAGMPLAAGAEADIGNFAAFLWRLNREHPELNVRPDPGPRPMLSGYGLKADLDLVRLTLAHAHELVGQAGDAGLDLRTIEPAAVIEALNRAAV